MVSNNSYYNYDTTPLDGEEWRYIPEFGTFYMVSNLGRIKSVDRYVLNGKGGKIFKKSQLISPGLNSSGYLTVCLKKDKKSKTISLHRLIALCFVDNPFSLPEVNHIDGNKQNNTSRNLEWCSRKENMGHSVLNKLRNYDKPFDCSKFKITEEEILFIYNSKESTSVLADKYNLTKSSIQRIRNGKTYSKITKGGKIGRAHV